jgi:sortase A
VGKLSRARRFLFASSMLGSLAALVLAVFVFAAALEPDHSRRSTESAIRTFVAAPLPPSPSPTPSPAVQDLPADTPAPPRAKAGPAIVQVGVMEIPKIGLVHPVFEGIDLRVIDHGPGHWPGSALPGRPGNSVFAGHRVTHSHPFLHIDQLVPGDQVIFRTAAGTAVYEVTEHLIVFPKDTWIVDSTSGSIVTFFGCHPPHSAKQRYVIRGRLVSTQPA